MKLSKERYDDGTIMKKAYTACGGKYVIGKCAYGWDLCEVKGDRYVYITARRTLRELREYLDTVDTETMIDGLADI